MGKKSSNQPAASVGTGNASLSTLLAKKGAVDPALASLFAASSGPVQKPVRTAPAKQASATEEVEDDEDEELDNEADLSSIESAASSDTEDEEDEDEKEVEESDEDVTGADVVATAAEVAAVAKLAAEEADDPSKSRKRKRKADDEDLEDAYLRKLARQEEKEELERKEERRQKQKKLDVTMEDAGSDNGGVSLNNDAEEDSEESNGEEEYQDGDEDDYEIPQHESLAPSAGDVELDKANRTVFLGNVASSAITSKSDKKTLMKHLSSILSSLPERKPPHKVESLRFRSTAYSNTLPKKAAFAKQELMDATTKTTNAYAVYTTQIAAKEAAKKLNGTIVLDRHLRVDLVAHPAKTDHHRCVFVGNLGFVDDESVMKENQAIETGERKRKSKAPSDVEEGLWREFSKVGSVESVRVVRDPKTRVGKGFAYVQFHDENSVEAALLLNNKQFPPMLPRSLRVVRAKAIKRKDVRKRAAEEAKSHLSKGGIYNPKQSSREQSHLGRAGKLLGRAGAAQARSSLGKPSAGSSSRRTSSSGATAAAVAAAGTETDGAIRKPEAFIFEGHRASAKQGKIGFKFSKGSSSSKKKTAAGGKPNNRSSKRAAAWKAGGGAAGKGKGTK